MTQESNQKKLTFQTIQNQIQKNKNTLNKVQNQTQIAYTQPKRATISNSVMIDFVMKIMEVQGQKVRIQLWEIAGNINIENTGSLAFAPLFVRNAIGCIIVVNQADPHSLLKAQIWKTKFDEATQLPGQNPFPSAVFVNHFQHQEASIINQLYSPQTLLNTVKGFPQNLERTNPQSSNSSQLYLYCREDDSTTIRSPDTQQQRNLMKVKSQSPTSIDTKYLQQPRSHQTLESEDEEFQFNEFKMPQKSEMILDELSKQHDALICHFNAITGENLQRSFESFVERVWNFSDKQRQQSNLLDDILFDNSYGMDANVTSESVLNTLGAERSRTTAHHPEVDPESEQFKTANASDPNENQQLNRISVQIMNSQSPLARSRYRNGQNSLLQLPLQGNQSKFDRVSVRLEEQKQKITKRKGKCTC